MIAATRSFLVPFVRRPVAAAGLGILICMTAAAILAPILAPYDPSKIEPIARLLPPDAAHWFGTDQFGRDILSRVIYGARLALLIGVGVVSFALVTGVPAGVLSALYPRFGRVMMRLIDVLMSFPALLLALGLIVILGLGAPPEVPSWGNMLAEGRIFITRAPWLLFFPGFAIAITAFSLNLVGDALRDRLDPRFRNMLNGNRR